jgi:hypothetical protein|nr:MAG TPA: putative methylase [Caudoviricetes sp.]
MTELSRIDYIAKEDVIDFMGKLPDECIDLIVTDPPYLINYKTNYRKKIIDFQKLFKTMTIRNW